MAQTTRTFRIFVSSTFSDLKEERNALQREVFPRLRQLCTQHGCRFQAIDLRWGVRDEAGLDQQTMKICLDEVVRSQRASPRPNFIILLGDRYGWRPIPSEIPAREFERIHEAATDTPARELLDAWYARDDNALHKQDDDSEPQPVYWLQPRSDRFTDFQVWEQEVERPLRAILVRAIDRMELTEEDRRKYEASATEQEIAAGALDAPDAGEHVFGFFRTVANLPQNESARDFIDLDEGGRPDAQAKARLTRLKNLLEKKLPENIRSYEASWTGEGASVDHIGSLPEDIETCRALIRDPDAPRTLCVDVWKRLAAVIEDEIGRIEKLDPLEKEIADHRLFARDRSRLFTGRDRMLQSVGDYLRGSDHHPLAVWGESGSGKSALMARAIAECGARNAECFIVSRFIGATPASSDGRALLDSLCREVSRAYGADEASVPTEYKELVKEFGERLKLATGDKPLVLFLDALDQLSDTDRARNLTWLPAELPEHVRLVVSTLPDECRAALDKKLPRESLVELEAMPEEEASELLESWLRESGRTLQPAQREEVLRKFLSSSTAADAGTEGGMPLYLKLAFEEARRWKSYTPGVELAQGIPGIIDQLFVRLSLDASHGAVVVSRSLGYVAAAKNGLSEDELLDVLSRDDDVMRDFKERARHTPPEARLPVVVWSRLFFDLEPYLSERSADGASLMSFYHRQLREVAEQKYMAGDDRRARHSHLARYFASQDLFDKDKRAANIRKLSELPYQQTLGEQWDELHATLTDFDFLEAKCAHVAVVISGKGDDVKTIYGGVYELQEDYRRALEKFPSE